MNTLQARIDEYLRDKAKTDDVELTKADPPEYFRESEEIEMRAMQESMNKGK